jgi:hypothetical protein
MNFADIVGCSRDILGSIVVLTQNGSYQFVSVLNQ